MRFKLLYNVVELQTLVLNLLGAMGKLAHMAYIEDMTFLDLRKHDGQPGVGTGDGSATGANIASRNRLQHAVEETSRLLSRSFASGISGRD